MRSFTLCLLVVALALTACSHNAGIEDQPAQAALPALSAIPGSPARSVSEIQGLPGSGALLTGGSIDNSNGQPRLTPAAGEMSFCIFEFDSTEEHTVKTLSLDLIGSGVTKAWVALSNYHEGHWQFLTAVTSAGGLTVDLTEPRGVYSNDAHTYVAVISYGPATFQINEVRLELIDPGWTHLYGDDADNNLIRSAPDGAGGMWAAGYHFETGDLVVVHIDAEGNIGLHKTLSFHKQFSPLAMEVDNAGQVYVGGQTFMDLGSGNGYLVLPFIIKLSAEGDVLWSREYQPADGRSGWITSLAFDDNAQLFYMASSSDARQLAAVDSEGNLTWSRSWDLDSYSNPDLVHIAGTLYIADTYHDPGPPIPSVGLLLSFSTAGDPEWGRRWLCDSSVPGDIGYSDYVRLEQDNQGRLIWAGSSLTNLQSDSPTWHLSLLTFRPDGTLDIVGGAQYSGNPAGAPIVPSGMAIDSLGHVYVSVSSLYGGYASLFTFMPDLTLHRGEYITSPLSGTHEYSFYDIDLFGDGDMFICGMGQHITDATWEDISSSSWTPQINPPAQFMPVIMHDTADWTSLPMGLSELGLEYTLDRNVGDEDLLFIRRLL